MHWLVERAWRFVRRGPENEELLKLYYGFLVAAYHRLGPSAFEHDKATEARLRRTLFLEEEAERIAQGNLPLAFNWSQAYQAEVLLASVRPGDQVVEELRSLAQRWRRRTGADPAFAARIDEFDEGLKNASDGQDLARARATLSARLIDHHWETSQIQLKRQIGLRFSRRIALFSAAALVLFLFAVGSAGLLSFFGLDWLRDRFVATALGETSLYTGTAIAAATGVLGASFSRLTAPTDYFQKLSIKAARIQASYPLLLVRHLIGGVAALILYFLFEAGLIDGLLFPDLEAVGFVRNQPQPVLGPDGTIARAVEATQSALEGINSPDETLQARIDAARQGFATWVPLQDLQTIRESFEGIEGLGPQAEATRDAVLAELEVLEARLTEPPLIEPLREDGWVPNADLSKLFIWSFLAGFSEKLVPSMLKRIDTGDRGA